MASPNASFGPLLGDSLPSSSVFFTVPRSQAQEQGAQAHAAWPRRAPNGELHHSGTSAGAMLPVYEEFSDGDEGSEGNDHDDEGAAEHVAAAPSPSPVRRVPRFAALCCADPARSKDERQIRTEPLSFDQLLEKELRKYGDAAFSPSAETQRRAAPPRLALAGAPGASPPSATQGQFLRKGAGGQRQAHATPSSAGGAGAAAATRATRATRGALATCAAFAIGPTVAHFMGVRCVQDLHFMLVPRIAPGHQPTVRAAASAKQAWPTTAASAAQAASAARAALCALASAAI